jgi:hypothetical protein
VLLSGITQGTGGAGALKAGDVVAIKSASLSTADGRFVAATSFTIAADATKPTATISPYVLSNRVWVSFSEPITTAAFNPATQLSTTGAATFGAATVTWYDVTPGSTSLASTALVQATGLFASNDTVTLAANSVADPAGNQNAAATGTAINDSAGPSAISSAKVASVAKPGFNAAVTVGGTGKVQVTAKSGTAAAGAAGNAWSVSIVDNNAAPSVAVNSTTKIVTIQADVNAGGATQPTADSVAAALNATPSFNALFTASASPAGNFDATAGATALTGGTNTTTLTLTFNEPIDPASVADSDFALDLDGNGVADIASLAGANVTTSSAQKAGVIVITLDQTTAAAVPVAGVAKVMVPGQAAGAPHTNAGVGAAGVDDLAGNVNTTPLTATLSS